MAANPTALAQGLQGYNFMLTPQANVQLNQLQQQKAFAQALQDQGLEPLSTNNRSIGGVGYAVSPLEGASKIAQALLGTYEQKDALNKFNDMVNPPPPPTFTQDAPVPDPQAENPQGTPGFSPPPAPPPANGVAPNTQGAYPGDVPPQVGAPGFQQLPAPQQQGAAPNNGGMPSFINPQYAAAIQQAQQKYGLTPFEAMTVANDPSALARVIAANAPTPEMKNAKYAYGDQGAPAAVANIMNLQQFPGQKTFQEGLGGSAAAQAPAGTPPAGPGSPIPNPPPRPAASFPPPVSGYSVQNDGIHLPVPPPPSVGPMQGAPGGLPPAAMATIQNAATPVGGAQQPQPAAGGSLPPINTAGMTNAQVQAAVDAQKAGAAAQATKAGENLADAQKGAASIDSRIGTAKDTLQHLIDIAPHTSSGMLIGAKEDFANQFNGKVAADNADFTNSSARLFLQEMPAVMASLSNRGNQFMERQIQEAGSIDLAMHPDAKIRVAQRLMTALDQAKQMQDTNVTLQGGVAPNSVNWVLGPNGTLVRQ